MWYSVHAVLYFRLTNNPRQSEFHVWEHVYLIEAQDFEDARVKGEIRARQDEGDASGSMTINGEPARLTLAGIRKIVECEDLDLQARRPVDGTELTYSKLLVTGEMALKALATGSAVQVEYLE